MDPWLKNVSWASALSTCTPASGYVCLNRRGGHATHFTITRGAVVAIRYATRDAGRRPRPATGVRCYRCIDGCWNYDDAKTRCRSATTARCMSMRAYSATNATWRTPARHLAPELFPSPRNQPLAIGRRHAAVDANRTGAARGKAHKRSCPEMKGRVLALRLRSCCRRHRCGNKKAAHGRCNSLNSFAIVTFLGVVRGAPCASIDNVAIGRASRRLSEIGSPVSSQ